MPQTIEISTSAAALVEVIYKQPLSIAKIQKKMKASEPKTVYRWLHQLHERGFDVVRRGFERFGDIEYSVEKLAPGFRRSRKKA